ncbi:DUF349 domain-containing protein [Echinicola strongylocentroti]|uniref:DUF349 domain-containing protein n=1 Tax=Echinicola strongylocentroti TaxID=1795355 RepID=A0A2Z4IGZ4_9BACT|nr:DUF349 domain-containing protein [Echinicola strongylocentroti]AWW29836.1 DUF349 domain-containing protein [Echinicola strongylocentroti]
MEHPYGYIKDDKVYLKGFLNQEDRVIGEVKENEASTIKYFEDRFELAKKKVADLKKDIEENQNKGSFLMKLVHLRESLMQYDALGDFVPLIDELNEREEYLNEIIQANRERNLEIKRELIEEAQVLMNDTDWKATSEKFRDLKLRWIKTGPVSPELRDEIEGSFKETTDTFFENRKNYFEGLALQAEENIKVYESLVEQAREAFNMQDVKQAFEISKRIQKQWKESGKVPAEKRQPLWDEFSRLNNKIFGRFKRTMQNKPRQGGGGYNSPPSRLRPFEVVKKIEKLAESMRDLSLGETTPEKISRAKRLQAEWKSLPPKKPREAQQYSRLFVFFTDIVFEKSFLHKLARSKFDNYYEMDEQEQRQVKINIMKDLISRDEKELETVKENSENFRSHESDFETMLYRKISAYKRKLDVKNHILKELSNK